MKKTLIVSFAMVAAVVTGSAHAAKADSSKTNVTKGVLSPTHANVTLAASADDASCNELSRACNGNRHADETKKSQRLMAAATTTSITKGSVSTVSFDEGERADSEEAIDYEVEYELEVL